MPLPATFWPLLIARALVALLCPRWPAVALYAALAAVCEVGRAGLLLLPESSLVIVADAAFFVLPSCVLAAACGASRRQAFAAGHIVSAALLAGALGPEWRRLVLVAGVTFVQGASMIVGLREEIRPGPPSWERRAAVVLAAIGVLGGRFSRTWPNVAAAGAAAYAFVLCAYFVQRARDDSRNRRGLVGAAEDDRTPAAEASPRTE